MEVTGLIISVFNVFEIYDQPPKIELNRNRKGDSDKYSCVNVNRKYIRKIRAMLHAWRKFGYVAAEEEILEQV